MQGSGSIGQRRGLENTGLQWFWGQNQTWILKKEKQNTKRNILWQVSIHHHCDWHAKVVSMSPNLIPRQNSFINQSGVLKRATKANYELLSKPGKQCTFLSRTELGWWWRRLLNCTHVLIILSKVWPFVYFNDINMAPICEKKSLIQHMITLKRAHWCLCLIFNTSSHYWYHKHALKLRGWS